MLVVDNNNKVLSTLYVLIHVALKYSHSVGSLHWKTQGLAGLRTLVLLRTSREIAAKMAILCCCPMLGTMCYIGEYPQLPQCMCNTHWCTLFPAGEQIMCFGGEGNRSFFFSPALSSLSCVLFSNCIYIQCVKVFIA